MRHTKRDIFITHIKQSGGTTRPVMSSQSLSDQSVRVNRTWQGERWEKEKYITSPCTNSGALFLLMTLCSQGNILYGIPSIELHKAIFLCVNVLKHILGYILPVSQDEQLDSLGNYAVAIRRPSPIFQAIKMDPFVIVDAAMRGQEEIVLNILNANSSYLLKTATVKNSVDVEHELTVFQAALACGDDEMCEKISANFKKITTDSSGNPVDGVTEMKTQCKKIYKESLRSYFYKQEAIKTSGRAIDETRYDIYLNALRSDDVIEIFNAHLLAQSDNAFDFGPYTDAIELAPVAEIDALHAIISAGTPEELDAAIQNTSTAFTQTIERRAIHFGELNLFEKMNRYREKLRLCMQDEIIFNPNHIMSILRINKEKYHVMNRTTDANYKKRDIILVMGVGMAKRLASETYKQDGRQNIYFLAEKKELRARPSYFNEYRSDSIVRNSRIDVSLTDPFVINGLGYRAVGRKLFFQTMAYDNLSFFLPLLLGNGLFFLCIVRDYYNHYVPRQETNPKCFEKLMLRKTEKLSELIMQSAHHYEPL